MECEVCHRERTFLYFIGKSNVCNKCVAKHTVFKEVAESEDTLLRKAMRAYDIKDFDELKNLTEKNLEDLESGKVKKKRNKTFKYKKNKGSAVTVGKGDYLDPQEELDMED